MKDTKGGGKGCINKRVVGRKGMESTKETIDAYEGKGRGGYISEGYGRKRKLQRMS